jgi:wyosine [tRNA(Phe)-imidazoG37] synthetase (radical SAM superfamily)
MNNRGPWRSLVARQPWALEVAGSNPAGPTIKINVNRVADLMRSVYGPVLSRRFGLSFGIDPTLPPKKCSFDCIYCQLDRTVYPIYEPIFSHDMTSPEKLRKDLEEYRPKEFDVITFSGSGEPTANRRIKELLDVVREFYSKPVYILTNGSFLSIDRVARAVAEFDHVSVKLDAWDERSFRLINNPYWPRSFENFLEGHKLIRRYSSSYSIQIMFTKLTNRKVFDIAFKLDPDKIYVTIPYRRFVEFMPDPEEFERMREYCEEHGCIVFKKRHHSGYISEEAIQELVSRRPMSIKDLAEALNADEATVRKIVIEMERFGKIRLEGDIVHAVDQRRFSF